MCAGNAQAGSQSACWVCAELQFQEFFIPIPSGLILSSHATLPRFTAGSKDLVPIWLGSLALCMLCSWACLGSVRHLQGQASWRLRHHQGVTEASVERGVSGNLPSAFMHRSVMIFS